MKTYKGLTLLKLIHFSRAFFQSKSTAFFGVAFLTVFAITFVAGFWPFDIHPKNEVSWLKDRKGVNFYGQSMILSPALWNEPQKSPFQDGAITVELKVRPTAESSGGDYIFCLYDGKTPEVTLFGQWRSHLMIRSRTDDPALRKRGTSYQEMGLRNALLKNQEALITVTSGTAGSVIYINGKLARSYPRYRLLSGSKEEPIRIILGNSPTGHSYWHGDISGLAVYNRVLTSEQVSRSYQEWISGKTPLQSVNSGCMALYLFDEREGKVVHNRVSAGGELMIQEVFAPLQRIVLISPWLDFEWSLEYFQDIAVNIFGFMPFGFFCAAFMFKAGKFRRKNIYWITALLGLGFGLVIELSQVYLPTRHSQLMDVIDNFAGTILGLILFHLVFDNKKTPAWTGRRLLGSMRNRD